MYAGVSTQSRTAQVSRSIGLRETNAGIGLHQNYFRDYAPNLGRYMQSDPIGLSGRTGNKYPELTFPTSYNIFDMSIIKGFSFGGSILFMSPEGIINFSLEGKSLVRSYILLVGLIISMMPFVIGSVMIIYKKQISIYIYIYGLFMVDSCRVSIMSLLDISKINNTDIIGLIAFNTQIYIY